MPVRYGMGNSYVTPKSLRGHSGAPSLEFYARLLGGPFRHLCGKARKGQCDDVEWVKGSIWFGDILERVGCELRIDGMNALNEVNGPCVVIANHMSTLETFLLPAIIRPHMPVTFVVKKSLATMPMFGAVMRSRDPIVVGRVNPRKDLAAVLDGGSQRLAAGTSIIVFPQSTRSAGFDEEHFNSIGVKLARKAGVPVIPLALKTDAWGQGGKIKELGKIRPDLPVRFQFGEPIEITGNGRASHEQICRFIGGALYGWMRKDGVNS